MKHLEEHIIELYVLNAQEVKDQEFAIEKHLAECDGCRTLAAELREFHNDLAEEIESGKVEDLPDSRSIIPSRKGVEPYFDPFVMPEPYTPTTVIGRFRYLVRRHPIKATVGGFGLAALAMFLLSPNFARRSEPPPISDYNAVNYQYNLEAGTLEVLNREDDVLWKMRVASAADADKEEDLGQFHTQIVDLDGDGINEVLTTASLSDFKDPNGAHLRIFDGHRNILKDTLFQRDFEYTGRTYSPFISAGPFIVRNSRTPGKKEILISGVSLGRSPEVIFRLDCNLKILGEFWHFGNLGNLFFRDIDRDGKQKLLVGGVNDTEDSIQVQYAVLAVLDPDRIVGSKRSNTSPGFVLEPSDAELYYLKFGKSDMDNLLDRNGAVEFFQEQSSSSFMAMVRTHGPNVQFDFHYLLDDTMNVLCVKSNNLTDDIHQQFVRRGSLKGRINTSYLEKLKDNVRYWDGRDWRREVVKVKHLTILP